MALKLKSRTEMPPDGIIIEIPQLEMTRANNRHRQYWSASEAIEAFKAIALKNPRFGLPTDDETIWNYLSQQNAIRVSNIPGADIYITREGGVAAALKKAGSHLPKLQNVAERSKLLHAGVKLLMDWKSQGYGVVHRSEANRRAEICSRCPKNEKGDFVRWFTVPASEQIKKDVEEFQASKITTDSDDKLQICSACMCPLKLKVHCEISLIHKHLLPEARQQLWSECWIVKEN